MAWHGMHGIIGMAWHAWHGMAWLRMACMSWHGRVRSRTYRVASQHAGPVGRVLHNLYFDYEHEWHVTCDFNKRIYFYRIASDCLILHCHVTSNYRTSRFVALRYVTHR